MDENRLGRRSYVMLWLVALTLKVIGWTMVVTQTGGGGSAGLFFLAPGYMIDINAAIFRLRDAGIKGLLWPLIFLPVADVFLFVMLVSSPSADLSSRPKNRWARQGGPDTSREIAVCRGSYTEPPGEITDNSALCSVCGTSVAVRGGSIATHADTARTAD